MVRLYLAIWNKNLLLLLVQENFLGCLYQHFQVLPLVFIDHCWLHFSRLLFHVTSISPWLFRSMKDCTSTELYPTAFCCFLCQVFCFWLFCRWRHFLLYVFLISHPFPTFWCMDHFKLLLSRFPWEPGFPAEVWNKHLTHLSVGITVFQKHSNQQLYLNLAQYDAKLPVVKS